MFSLLLQFLLSSLIKVETNSFWLRWNWKVFLLQHPLLTMFLYRITWIWLTSFLRDLYHYNFLLYFHGNNSVLCCYFFFSWAISVIYQEHYPFYAEAHMKLVMQYQLITLSNISRWSLLCSISRYLPWAVSVACYGDGTINDWTKDQIEDSTLFFHMNFLLMYKKVS